MTTEIHSQFHLPVGHFVNSHSAKKACTSVVNIASGRKNPKFASENGPPSQDDTSKCIAGVELLRPCHFRVSAALHLAGGNIKVPRTNGIFAIYRLLAAPASLHIYTGELFSPSNRRPFSISAGQLFWQRHLRGDERVCRVPRECWWMVASFFLFCEIRNKLCNWNECNEKGFFSDFLSDLSSLVSFLASTWFARVDEGESCGTYLQSSTNISPPLAFNYTLTSGVYRSRTIKPRPRRFSPCHERRG